MGKTVQYTNAQVTQQEFQDYFAQYALGLLNYTVFSPNDEEHKRFLCVRWGLVVAGGIAEKIGWQVQKKHR